MKKFWVGVFLFFVGFVVVFIVVASKIRVLSSEYFSFVSCIYFLNTMELFQILPYCPDSQVYQELAVNFCWKYPNNTLYLFKKISTMICVELNKKAMM